MGVLYIYIYQNQQKTRLSRARPPFHVYDDHASYGPGDGDRRLVFVCLGVDAIGYFQQASLGSSGWTAETSLDVVGAVNRRQLFILVVVVGLGYGGGGWRPNLITGMANPLSRVGLVMDGPYCLLYARVPPSMACDRVLVDHGDELSRSPSLGTSYHSVSFADLETGLGLGQRYYVGDPTCVLGCLGVECRICVMRSQGLDRLVTYIGCMDIPTVL
jgi:hypothetical protein